MDATERQAIADIIKAELSGVKSDVSYLRGCSDTGKNTVGQLIKSVIIPLLFILAGALGLNLAPLLTGGAR